MLHDILIDIPKLSYVSHELDYFRFELDRELRLEAEEDVTLVEVFRREPVRDTTVEVGLPSADEMAGFDTLEIDLGAYCADHLDENCGEWDYLSHLFVCDRPIEAENPLAATSCRPAVPGVEAAAEILGICAGDGDQMCRADLDCGEGILCEGYVPPREAVEAAPAETRPCVCTTPLGDEVGAQHVCRGDGTGFGDCGCACGTEMGRWITTYAREGRWVTDASSLLALVRDGGRQRFRIVSGNPYDMDLTFRLSRRGDGGSPDEARPLFAGGPFTADYNEGREPYVFVLPEGIAGVERVEIVAFVTGHGFGLDTANCAEFCDHTHQFEVNGVEFVKQHVTAGSAHGCLRRVSEGVVPNQYGTWPYGRGGWCPGLDVEPWVADVTDALQPGENVITYRGLLMGNDYHPVPVVNPGGGFGARIDLTSYLVFWR